MGHPAPPSSSAWSSCRRSRSSPAARRGASPSAGARSIRKPRRSNRRPRASARGHDADPRHLGPRDGRGGGAPRRRRGRRGRAGGAAVAAARRSRLPARRAMEWYLGPRRRGVRAARRGRVLRAAAPALRAGSHVPSAGLPALPARRPGRRCALALGERAVDQGRRRRPPGVPGGADPVRTAAPGPRRGRVLRRAGSSGPRSSFADGAGDAGHGDRRARRSPTGRRRRQSSRPCASCATSTRSVCSTPRSPPSWASP